MRVCLRLSYEPSARAESPLRGIRLGLCACAQGSFRPCAVRLFRAHDGSREVPRQAHIAKGWGFHIMHAPSYPVVRCVNTETARLPSWARTDRGLGWTEGLGWKKTRRLAPGALLEWSYEPSARAESPFRGIRLGLCACAQGSYRLATCASLPSPRRESCGPR